MKEQILKLREEGKTYDEIKAELNCAKSTIAYHCNEEVKIKQLKRQKATPKTIRRLFMKRLSLYNRRTIDNYSKISVDDFMKKIGDFPRCYLTGRLLDLSEVKSYQIDHIIPFSKGGKHTLDNIDISCSEANYMKSNLTMNELISLMTEIFIKLGYLVKKKKYERNNVKEI